MSAPSLIVGLLALAAAVPAVAGQDDFNRTKLGNKWVVVSPSLTLSANQLTGSDGALGYFTKAAAANTVKVKVSLNGTAIQYGAVTLGDVLGGNYIFVKIQSQNGDGMFDHGAIYVGNRGGSFFSLREPMASPATMTVSLQGSIATLSIESLSGKQTYAYNVGSSVPTGGGLGTYGAVALDDFKYKASPAGALDAPPIVVRGSTAHDLTR